LKIHFAFLIRLELFKIPGRRLTRDLWQPAWTMRRHG